MLNLEIVAGFEADPKKKNSLEYIVLIDNRFYYGNRNGRHPIFLRSIGYTSLANFNNKIATINFSFKATNRSASIDAKTRDIDNLVNYCKINKYPIEVPLQ
jgi:hypothetical protein